MKDGEGDRRCRWWGHKLYYAMFPDTPWPPDQYWGDPPETEMVVCKRCDRKYTYVDESMYGNMEPTWLEGHFSTKDIYGQRRKAGSILERKPTWSLTPGDFITI